MHSETIILSTLNARYFHASLGLRYLLANMGDLTGKTSIREFTIEQRPLDIVEQLLRANPSIVGFGVYIWNVEQITKVIALLKSISPQLVIVIGGPEVSYEGEDQTITELCDHVITGMADLEFSKLCNRILTHRLPSNKIVNAPNPELEQLTLPYSHYTGEDISNRFIYVEASRGCPFKCDFCLSALDKTAWPFDQPRFLQELELLYQRGARHYRFVDRTFNLNTKISVDILRFFVERLDPDLFVHFEVIPDRLPEQLKTLLPEFPPGTLQLEIGIQTFSDNVQKLISRKQNNDKAVENLAWLCTNTNAHIHADLIFGLPGEDLNSFALSFNKLVAIRPHEIQLGLLKRLRGSPIIRHTKRFTMTYNPSPPYNIVSTSLVDFDTMQRVGRFARYWDLIANSGRFKHSLPLILGVNPFDRFLTLSDWIYTVTGQTHRIALHRLFDLVYLGLTSILEVDEALAIDKLTADKGGDFRPPRFSHKDKKTLPTRGIQPTRQIRHIS